MDPNACLLELLVELAENRSGRQLSNPRNADVILEKLENLRDWFEDGGFRPDVERVGTHTFEIGA